jgi:hypothetical protein
MPIGVGVGYLPGKTGRFLWPIFWAAEPKIRREYPVSRNPVLR